MKVLVCGDRRYAHPERVRVALDALDRLNGIETVIEGTAAGADTFGGDWARDRGVKLLEFPPRWDLYGRAAGPVRNREMLHAMPDVVLAFHDNIAESKGTADMINQARRAGIPVRLYGPDGSFTLIQDRSRRPILR